MTIGFTGWRRTLTAEFEFIRRTADGDVRSPMKSLSLAVKLVARLLIHLPGTLRLAFSLIADCGRTLQQGNPGIHLKHLRRGYETSLNTSLRATIVAHHYRTVSRRLGPDFLKHSLRKGGVVIWSATDDESGPRIVASTASQYDFESELNLLFKLDDEVLYVMGCIVSPGEIWKLESQPVLVITRVQGIRTTLPQMKTATAICGDCAPRLVLFSAMEGLATAMSIRTMVGIGIRKQIATAFGSVKSPSFAENYDELWLILGAKSRSDGNFVLSTPAAFRPLTSIVSKHRGRAHRRRIFRNIVTSEVASRFVDVKREP